MVALPLHLKPMLATLGTMPPAAQDDQWGYEMKWDGIRAITRIDQGSVVLISRNDVDMTVSYPELQRLGEALSDHRIILDGEIVSFAADGRPSFGRLQKRMHITSATMAEKLSHSDPAVLLLFDLLHLDGDSLLDLPYHQRRALLEELGLDGPSWQTPPAFHGSGPAAVELSKQSKLEGVVAKRRTSIYRPGARTPDWIKLKNILTQEVVVVGWTQGAGRRAGTVGALLLGLPDGGGTRYVGKVGTGFTDQMLRELSESFAKIAKKTPAVDGVPTAEARAAHWLRPVIVGEVAFSEWTGDGRLRHPSWRGLRPDKTADEVVPES